MRGHSEYVEVESLLDMIREDLVAERIAIEFYSEINLTWPIATPSASA